MISKWETVLNMIDICLWSIDAKSMCTIQISPLCEKIFGLTEEEFKAQTFLWEDFVYPYDLSTVLHHKDLLYKGNSVQLEYRIMSKSGQIKWIADSIVPIIDDETIEIIRFDRVVKDITSAKETEEKLQHMAYHDYLTGLPNRRKFNEELLAALSIAKNKETKVAVMYLDLDRFKYFNDTLGHKIGDTILQIMADRLRGCLRREDVVSRQGGDEFVLLLKDITSNTQLNTIAQKIHQVVCQPVRLLDNELIISTSIGISIFPDHGLDIEGLITHADQAMYDAKEKNIATQTYSQLMSNAFSRKLIIEQHLHKAIENNELHLAYQPIVDVYQKKIIGLEALARWNHPELGNISPLEFIKVAEETDLIVKLGDWVFRTACQHRKLWTSKNLPPFYISINVSGKQLQKENFINGIKVTLNEYGVNPHLIKIELTESTAMADVKRTKEILDSLHDLGVEMKLDDFGTGYSSLSYLVSYPFHTVKIDQSFIRNLDKQNQRSISRAIVGIGRNLGMKVIAEGVEDIEQMQYLCSIGCHLMQGYHFSKPVTFEEIEQLF